MSSKELGKILARDATEGVPPTFFVDDGDIDTAAIKLKKWEANVLENCRIIKGELLRINNEDIKMIEFIFEEILLTSYHKLMERRWLFLPIL